MKELNKIKKRVAKPKKKKCIFISFATSHVFLFQFKSSPTFFC